MLIKIDENGTTAAGKFKLVPVEPTEEMKRAATTCMASWIDIKGTQLTVNLEKARVRYKAMLAAAPVIAGTQTEPTNWNLADECLGGVRLTSEPCSKCGATEDEDCRGVIAGTEGDDKQIGGQK